MPVDELERRYALTQVDAGDYLMPANDLQVLWRISTYDEDGSAYWIDPQGRERHIVGTFWRLRYCPFQVDAFRHYSLGQLLELRWVDGDGGFKTRREAITAALRSDARRIAA